MCGEKVKVVWLYSLIKIEWILLDIKVVVKVEIKEQEQNDRLKSRIYLISNGARVVSFVLFNCCCSIEEKEPRI